MRETRLNPTLIAFGCGVTAMIIAGWASLGRELSIHDEAHGMLAAHTITEGVRGLLQGTPLSEIRESLHQSGGTLYFMAKPLYPMLVGGVGILIGTASSTLGHFVNALATGIAAGSLAFIVGRSTNTATMLYATALFLSLPIVFLFSGTTLPIIGAVAFALLSAALLQGSPGRPRILLAGIVGALGVLTHYLVLPTLILYAGILWWLRDSRQLLFYPLGAGLFLAFFEGLLQVVRWGIQAVYPEFQTFFGELFAAVRDFHLSVDPAIAALPVFDGVRGYTIAGYTSFVYTLSTLIGPVVFVGSLLVFLRWSDHDPELIAFAAVFVGLTFALWFVYPWKVERSFLLPAIAMAGCTGIVLGALDWRLAIPLLVFAMLTNLLLGTAKLEARTQGKVFAQFARNADPIFQALPAGSLTGSSLHQRAIPIWKWHIGARTIQSGGSVHFADWSNHAPPQLFIVDHFINDPDPRIPANVTDPRHWRVLLVELGRDGTAPISLRQRIPRQEGN